MSFDPEDHNGGLCGLANFGATCYLNSLLQALFSNNYLLDFILNGKYNLNDENKDIHLLNEIKELMEIVWKQNCIIAPKKFVHAFSQMEKMDLNEQNDPDEFYEKIMNYLYEETCELIENCEDNEWNKYFKNKHSYINEQFYGQYKSDITCLECNHSSLTYNPYISLKLELVSSSMINCLKSHLSWENNITYTCEKCKCENKAKKRFTILKVPNVFVVTLKRYTNFGQKKDIVVEYPLLFEIDNVKLELYAMIAHMGNHVYCGHYTSYIKNMKNSEWYHIDDNNMEKINIDSIDKSDVYMLFYKKI